FQSGLPSAALSVESGLAVRVNSWPTASPIRLSPKSNPSRVPAARAAVCPASRAGAPLICPPAAESRVTGIAREQVQIHAQQRGSRPPPFVVRDLEQDVRVRRAAEPGVVCHFLFQLAGAPASIA